MKLIWLLCGRSKLTCYRCSGLKTLFFSISIEIDLVFARVVQIGLISFSVGKRIWLDFSVEMVLISLFCGWSKLIWVLYAGRKACKLTWILWGWSKSTWFQRGGSNLTWFQSRIKWIGLLCGLSKTITFQFGGSALIWFSCNGRKWLIFSVRIEINWVFMSCYRNRLEIGAGIEIDFITVVGSNFSCFLRAGSKSI